MASQRECILKAAQAIWDDFKTKTRDHVAPKYQTSAFPAMVGSNIFLWSWDKILALTVEIANIIKTEKDLKPEVGVFAFGHKKAELLRQAAFVFTCGDRTGSRSAALQMLLPLVHTATYDAAAEQRAQQIGGDYTPLYSTHQTAGTDVNLAIAQQRPEPDQPLIMNLNLLVGQVDLPRHWQQQVVDDRGWPIPVPTDPEVPCLDCTPLFFDVRQDTQPVQVPTQLVKDQDFPQDQMQQI